MATLETVLRPIRIEPLSPEGAPVTEFELPTSPEERTLLLEQLQTDGYVSCGNEPTNTRKIDGKEYTPAVMKLLQAPTTDGVVTIVNAAYLSFGEGSEVPPELIEARATAIFARQTSEENL